MRAFRPIFAAVVLACLAGAAAAQSVGSLEVSGRVKIGGKVEKLTRKRFFLLRGGLEANKAVVDRMKAAAFVSRDCFYCEKKASPEFIAWLKAGDCESPFCRAVGTDDARKVPEFAAALAKGTRQYGGKAAIAQQWLTTNLSADLLSGLYRLRKTSTDTILGGTKPVQSSMTDTVTVKAIFIDIPVSPAAGKTSETFLLSNIVPIEFGTKSYLWACELEIGAAKKVTLPLQVPDPGKTVRKCEVFVKDLAPCAGGACPSS